MNRFFHICIALQLVCVSTFSQYVHSTFNNVNANIPYLYEQWQNDGYTTGSWEQGLQNRTIVDNSTSVSGTQSLRITYPAGGFGPDQTGAQIQLYVEPAQEMYMSYWIKFSDNFSYGTSSFGGKIPGISGGDDCSGGESCNGTNGFSCRFMWRANGRICLYLYDMLKTQTYGLDFYLAWPDGSDVIFERGKWYHLTERVKVNSTPTSQDGEVEAWVNGIHVLHVTGRQFTTNGEKADKLYLSTFHGGSDATWCPTETCYIWFDDMKISTDFNDVKYQECSQPNLGKDKSLCGKSSITLNTGISNHSTTFTWVKDKTILGTNSTLTVTEPGTYVVIADSLGCSRKDTVQIYSTLQPNLGEDISLCEYSYQTLDSKLDTTAIDFEWSRNGSILEGETESELKIKDAGTYEVLVSAKGCASASDEINVTSNMLQIPDVQAETDKTATLTINNPAETEYDWFTDSLGTTLIHSGTTFSTAVPQTTTYYVGDHNKFSGYIGMKKIDISKSYTRTPAESMKFEVFRTMTIDSVSIFLVNVQNIVIDILAENKSTKVFTKSFGECAAGDQRLSLNATLEPGIYYMSAKNSTGTFRHSYEADENITFPYTVAGVMSILGSSETWIDAKPWYLYFYNWKISSGNTCALVPATISIPKVEESSNVNALSKSQILAIAIDRTIYCNCTEFQIFNINNQNVTSQNGFLTRGVYFVRTKNETQKVLVK